MAYDSVKGSSQNVQFTLQDSIDHCGVGLFQVKLAAASGLTWMADSMEIMLLSILGPILSCDWQLQPWEEAFLTTLVMAGMTIGSPYWGKLSDLYGRKTGLTIATVMIGYLGFLSAFSPMYTWMAILRFLVGCCLGALPQTATLFSEYLPTTTRSSGMLLLSGFFTIGAVFEVLLAMIVVPTLGWRYLMAFTALPVLIFPILSPWLPESARYCMISGRHDEAVELVRKVARINNKTMLPGQLAPAGALSEKRGKAMLLLRPSHRKLTIVLNVLWFIFGFLYYGIALILPTVFNEPDGCHGYDVTEDTGQRETCFATCEAFSTSDYIALAVSSFADIPGVFVAFILLLYMGRKSCMALCSLVCATSLFVSNICMNRLFLTAVIFVARASVMAAYQTMYTFTAECYETNIRAVAMGVGGFTAKFGAVLTPYVAQVLTASSAFASFTVYGVMGFIAVIACFLLPFDTRGRPMQDISH